MAGLLAGWTALALDLGFAYLLTGDPLPVDDPGLFLAYGAVGAVVGCLLGTAAWVRRRAGGGSWTFLELGALALAGVYALPAGERLYDVAVVQLGRQTVVGFKAYALAALAGLVAVAAIGAASWWLGRRASSVADGGWIAGLAASAGLALNRSGTGAPLDPLSLAADLVVVLLAAATAELIRRRGRAVALVLLGTLALSAVAVTEWRIRRAQETPAEVVADSEGEAPPSLILLVVDTLRADVFRSVVEHTPEGRAFAAHFDDAAWFERAQAASPWTAPSMGSILTGLYPAEHGFGAVTPSRDPNRTLVPLAPSLPTLAGRLARRGYLTEAVLANPILFPGSGIDRGFQRYRILADPNKRLPMLFALARLGLRRIHAYQNAEQVHRQIVRRLPAWSEARRPVFLWLHLLDPHGPLRPHPDLPEDPSAAGLDDEQRLYRNEVRFTFLHLDRTIRALQDAGLWQKSVTIFVSDHGEMLHADGHEAPILGKDGKPMRRGHGKALYHELMEIPLIVRPPEGLEERRRIDALVSHADLHDTVADLLDVGIPKVGRDRVSLAPYLAPSPPTEAPERAWALLGGIQAGVPQRGLVTDRHKLIVYQRKRPPELYDRHDDPTETRNLAAQDPDRAVPLRERLDAAWSELEIRDSHDPAELDEETRNRLKALGYLQ